MATEKIVGKRTLSIIAKRWCKGVLMASEASVSFCETGLTVEEMDFIQEEIKRIASRITSEEEGVTAHSLVNEYYEPNPSHPHE